MNSYPPELLAQLAPVMFVAGLDPQAAPNSSPVPPPKLSDPFQVLSLRLREALLAHRKVAIWQPEKNKSFQVVLVNKDVKFPPRKLDDPQHTTAHSPLSPLSQTSPLYPDGLIAPVWVRKHTSLVPSVFVLFLRIFEYPPFASRAPLDIPDAVREREREAEERRRDSDLAAEVAQRKKMTTERGIKLTVVLMASRKMLDDPTLDSRLTFIRRQSGLDSRAALFVLSPVSPAELNDFVRSLQQALYEPAVEYYTSHSKRVRRKRNRHSQDSSGYLTTSTLGGLNNARPLRSEGWTVRYEYKMACFAEFRSEDEVALKHYQDAYEMLIIMFGSTAILPPRTKRWAEAKVLADCINIKIVKLYLYNNEHALALSHHSTHIRHFGDFSRGWGIGEETFEYWSWIARQHRVLAELLEQGTRSTLEIPAHKPALPNSNFSQSQQNLRAVSGLEYGSLGINPSHALQHPGFYYYMAARCTEMRRSRFLAAVESEISHKPIALSPGFANEKKVEHLAIINELYTKSYELFKKYCSSSNQGQGRLTLWIAYRIAQTYYDAGKYDMAVRFFERIAKTYRREKWYSMLRPLLLTWYACAKQLRDVELSIKLLIEMLGHDEPDPEDPSLLEEDLLAVLKNTVPSVPGTTLIADLVEAHPIFDSNVVFWSSEVKVGELAAFQLTMTAPTSISIALIPFSRLTLHLSNDSSPIVVHHAPSDVQLPIQRVVIGHHVSGQDPLDVIANLRWQPDGTIVFTGSISSEVPLVLKITAIVLTVEENGWKVDIPFEPCGTRSGSGPVARWLRSVDPPQFIPVKRSDYNSTLVNHRQHQLKISFHHEAPAYVDQDYPITVEVTNTDIRDLGVVVNILLQPTEIDDAVNWIVVEDTRSSSLIKGIQLGVLAPGVTIVKILHLFNTGASGDRMIDISIQSRTVIAGKYESDHAGDQEDDEVEEDFDGETSSHDSMEHLHMIVIPTTNPFKLSHSVVYRHALDPWPGLANLETFDQTFWDDRRGGQALVTATLSCVGPSSLNIENLRLERQDNLYAKIINSSMDEQDEDMLPAEFIQGDEISGSCTIGFSLEDERDPIQDPVDGPGRYVVTWCRVLQNGTHGPTAISYFPFPSLQPPVDNIVALLDVPPQGTLHVPMFLTLTIRNYHLTRSANIVVQLEPDSMDGFVVSGLRNGRVPVLLPGSEEKLIWNIIPIECGFVKVPRIKVTDRRKTIPGSQGTNEFSANVDAFAGDLVKVVSIRRGVRQDVSQIEGSDSVNNQSSADEQEISATVLVLP